MKQEEQEKKNSLLFRLFQSKQKDDAVDIDAVLGEFKTASAKTAPIQEDQSVQSDSTTNTSAERTATLPNEPVSSSLNPQDEAEKWISLTVPSSWEGYRRLRVQVNKMTTKARIFLRPPAEDEPETCTLEILHRMLKDCRIAFGIDEEALKSFFPPDSDSLLYNTPVIIARGIPPVNGVDGYVKELFDRASKPHFDQRPDGSIDFKNMHIVNNVSKGTVICEIVNPIQGTIGTSVYNKPIRPRIAKAPAIPRGENLDLVTIDDSMSQLVAAIDGNLIYKDGRFCIEHTFRVNGNVNNSVGNINFTGNVIVTGDVCEGYSIKTNGDVTVYGIVEGASIYAGGNIVLQKGINGMGKGILEAHKAITAKFIENCTVRAGEDIKSESIINSTVESDGAITLTGRGTLVGGSITVFGSIDAKVVGSRSNTPINIVLGVTPHMLRERIQIREQHKAVLAEFQSLNSDILYLEQATNLSEAEREHLLTQYKGKLNLVLFKKNRLEKKIQKYKEQQSQPLPCTLTCNTAYPPLRITIGSETFRLSNVANMCRFYQNSQGVVVLGSK